MSDLRDLYQEVILDHGRRPRNFACPADANREAHGDNPLCGDRVTVYLTIKDGLIDDVGFDGRGCAISMASASLMTEEIKGKTEKEAREIFTRFRRLVSTKESDASPEGLDRLVVLGGVRQFPSRVKCATLAWHTMASAMNSDTKPVTTE